MEDKQATAQLADYSGDGRSTYPHVQPKDEHWVQGDVEHRPKHHRLHPLLGKALADDKLVHSVGQQGEYRAEQVVGVIVQSIGQGGLTGSEKQEQRPPGQQGTGHQEHRQHVKQEKAVCQYLSGLGQVTLAHSNGHQGGTADPYQKGHGADHGDHGTTDAGPRQGQVADLRDIPDVDAVHNAVQHTDKLGQHTGNRNIQDQLSDGIAAQIIFQFHVLRLSTHFF